MSADGYTLAEMLAALAILGLAFGGLAEGARALAQMQSRAVAVAGEATSDVTVQLRLQQVVSGAGPFFSDGRGGLRGDARRVDLQCGAQPCSARVEERGGRFSLVTAVGARERRILLAGPASFSFVDQDGFAAEWPTERLRPTRLRDLLLRSDQAGTVLATARLWNEEPQGCVFDAIAQGCRS